MLEQLRAAVSSDQVVDSDKLAANLTKALGDDPALAQIGTDISTQVMNAISTQIAPSWLHPHAGRERCHRPGHAGSHDERDDLDDDAAVDRYR